MPRFYQGITWALIQTPLTRFGGHQPYNVMKIHALFSNAITPVAMPLALAQNS